MAEESPEQYLALADDGALAEKKREAGILFGLAESHINEGEDAAEALKAATEALRLAREAKDSDVVIADTLHLIVKANILKSQTARAELGADGLAASKVALAQALGVAETELSGYAKAGNKRGRAVMLLALSEVHQATPGVQHRAVAISHALQARTLFEEIGDKKMHAHAMLVMATALVAERDQQKAQEAADAALTIFRNEGDKVAEARAWHAASLSKAMEDTYIAKEEALRYAREGMTILHEMGLKRQQAAELINIAKLGLAMGHPEEALPVAKGASDILWELSDHNARQAEALGVAVEALLAQELENQAVRTAKEGVLRFQKAEDKRQEVMGQELLAKALLARGSTDEALRVTLDARAMAADALDTEWEARMSLMLCQVHTETKDYKKALVAAWDAVALYNSCEDRRDDVAVAQLTLASTLMYLPDAQTGLKAAYASSHLFAEAKNVRGEGQALLLAATGHAMFGDHSEALAAVGLAREMFEKAKDRQGQAATLSTATEIYMAKKDYEEALASCTQRKDILSAAGYKKEEARAMMEMAVVHVASGEDGEAAKVAREGLRIARAASDRATEINLLLQIIQADIKLILDQHGSFEEAPRAVGESCLKMVRDAVALSKKQGSGRLRAPALFWNAQVLMMQGQDSMTEATEAMMLFRQEGDKSGEAHTLALVAQIHFGLGNMDKALQACTSALTLFQEEEDQMGKELAMKVMKMIKPDRPAYQPQQMMMAPQALPAQQEAVASQAQQVALSTKLSQPAIFAKLQTMTLDILSSGEGEIDGDSPLMDMGMDSLSSVQFRNDVAAEFSVKLGAALIFDYPTIKALSHHLHEVSNES